MSEYIDQVFGPGGILDNKVEGYEMRPGQVELARAFHRAIMEGRDLAAEGPTGVGKSFAYLVPATKYASEERKRKILVVTSGIALQEQLINKDLPMLERVLPWDFTYALLKGRGNYICRQKLGEFMEKLSWNGDDLGKKRVQPAIVQTAYEQTVEFLRWYDDEGSGDKSDLHFEYPLWYLISAGQDECLGGACPHKRKCYANRARRRATVANIIVMNYHLRLIGGGAAAPDHDVMICDEAHELPDIARALFGWTLTPGAVNRVSNWLRKNSSFLTTKADKELPLALSNAAGSFFELVARKIGGEDVRRLYTKMWANTDGICAALNRAAQVASNVADVKAAGGDRVRSKRAAQMAHRAMVLSTNFNSIASLKREAWTYWLAQDKKKQRYTVEARPLIVSEILKKELFNVRSVGMISATMTSGGSFEFIRGEIGVPEEAGELIVPSPFNLSKQGILVVPGSMPPPPRAGNESATLEWQAEVAGYAADLIEMCGGRSLLLFTSWRNLGYVAKELESYPSLNGFRIMKQGDMPKTKLLKEFKQDEQSVLLAVASFWTGVDVPGRSLTGLLIDKIPFPVPTDPINKGMEEFLISQGRDPFMEKVVPQATIALRQGIGRLIRKKTDVGVVVITDSRLVNKPYGTIIRRSLPRFRDTDDIEDGYAFMEEKEWV